MIRAFPGGRPSPTCPSTAPCARTGSPVASGPRQTPLAAGSVDWFTPGTIRRAVNHSGLTVVVVMANAGLPEAGDAVMTFPRTSSPTRTATSGPPP